MRRVLPLIFILSISKPILGQQYSITWSDTLDLPRHNNAEDITFTQNAIYVAGSSDNGTDWDGLLVKYDTLGNVVWIDTIDNGHEDYVYSVFSSSDGFIYVAGRTNDGSTTNFMLVKYDSAMNRIWMKTFDNGGNDAAYDVYVDNAGNVYITGTSNIGGQSDFLTIKYTPSGAFVWADTFNVSTYDYSEAIAVDNFGNVLVLGYTYVDTGPDYDYIIIKYDSLANMVWVDTMVNAGADYPHDIGVEQDGNIYITGSIATVGSEQGFLTMKYSPEGNIIWADTFGIRYQDMGKDLYVGDDGYVYVTGYVYSFDNDNDCLVMKYDSSGNIVWADTIDVDNGINGRGIVVDSRGDIYLTCTATSIYNNNIVTIKYTPESNVRENGAARTFIPLEINTPGNHTLNLNWKGEKEVLAYLYTTDGRLFKSVAFRGKTCIYNLQRGVYFIQLDAKNLHTVRKVIVR